MKFEKEYVYIINEKKLLPYLAAATLIPSILTMGYAAYPYLFKGNYNKGVKGVESIMYHSDTKNLYLTVDVKKHLKDEESAFNFIRIKMLPIADKIDPNQVDKFNAILQKILLHYGSSERVKNAVYMCVAKENKMLRKEVK